MGAIIIFCFFNRGVAQPGLARLLWEQEVVSSNLTAPICNFNGHFLFAGIKITSDIYC
jgi:hypothetical protein